MSQLSKSLKKRIHELTASIESHRVELAAYERVLHLELSNAGAPGEIDSDAPEAELTISAHKKVAAAESGKQTPAGGTKIDMLIDVVKSYGNAGATPKEIDAFFAAKGIPRSKNLIYNTLSYLVARKRLKRRDGKYFLGIAKKAAKKAVKKAAKKVSEKVAKKAVSKKTVAKVKRRLSPEGLKRIREALKKRWAVKKAAEAAPAKPAATKTAVKTS